MKNIIFRVYLRYFDFYLLDRLIDNIKIFCNKFNVKFSGPVSLPTKKERFNILRSPHVNKKSRDQLEISTHKKLIDFYNISKDFIFSLKEFFLSSNIDFFFKVLS